MDDDGDGRIDGYMMGCFNGATAMMPWMTGVVIKVNALTVKLLQWGHGDDAVDDVAISGTGDDANVKLQWGHGDDAVDDGWMAVPTSEGATGFNGATAMMPWMTSK